MAGRLAPITDAEMDAAFFCILAAALEGRTCPSNDTLGKAMGRSKGSGERAVRRLEAEGAISVVHHRCNVRSVSMLGYTTARPEPTIAISGSDMESRRKAYTKSCNALRRAIANYHVKRGRSHWQALAA